MKVYDPLRQKHYEFCYPVNHEDFDTINAQIDGQPRQAVWKSPAMELIRVDDKGRTLLPSDSPWLGTSSALIFRPAAIMALGQLLREYGELLPLQCEAKLSIFNCTRVVDALDEEASTLSRFEDGRIMWIRRHVFRPEVIRGVEIFKLANLRVSSTFVGSRFVEMWHAAGLKGLEFPQMWAGD